MPGQRSMRVLLVDDGRGSAEALSAPIRAMGHEVWVADRTVALAGDWSAQPDVVVLDLDTGVPELLKGLYSRAGRRKPLVLILSEGNDQHAECQGGENRLPLVLVKPICLAVLTGVFRRFRELLTGVGVLDSENGHHNQ